jgi:hypothetical protein
MSSDSNNGNAVQAGATLTIRVIKSFEYRTEKNVILHHIPLATTTGAQLKEMVRAHIAAASGFAPYRNLVLDTLKLYVKAHEFKSQHLIINLDDGPDLMVRDDVSLAEQGLAHETEVSFYNQAAFDAYKQHPETKW